MEKERQDKKKVTRARKTREERQEDIICAALEIFWKDGFWEARMDDIAAEAGVAKGTLYLYFASKEELFKAVVQHRLISELRHLEDYSDQHTGTAEELLRHIIKIVYQRIIKTEKSKILFLMISEGKKFPELISYYHENVLVRVKNRIRKIILVGIERGEFRECALRQFPELIMGQGILAVVWNQAFGDVKSIDLDEYMKGHIDLVFNGLLNK